MTLPKEKRRLIQLDVRSVSYLLTVSPHVVSTKTPERYNYIRLLRCLFRGQESFQRRKTHCITRNYEKYGAAFSSEKRELKVSCEPYPTPKDSYVLRFLLEARESMHHLACRVLIE